jgi:predicted Rossmann fold flavoprotein
MPDTVIIGAGAAGMAAAYAAARRGLAVVMTERNSRPGRKLMITGKGRCNLTNACGLDEFLENVLHSGRFLYSALTAFGPKDTMDFFEGLGVPLKIERGKRVFPVSDKASDIVDALAGCVSGAGCRMINGRVKSVDIASGCVRGVMLDSGEKISAGSVIVCTGGTENHAKALAAGVDILMPGNPKTLRYIKKALKQGSLSQETIRLSAIRILNVLLRSGVYRQFLEDQR